MAYQYDIRYKPTSQHGNADALSRLPYAADPEFDKTEACLNVDHFETPVNPSLILKHLETDDTLKKVRSFIRVGWPKHLSTTNSHILPFFNKKISLTVNNDIIYLQGQANRVVIPLSLRKRILQLLHDGHWGVVKMKQLARSHCWWPGIDKSIENLAKDCKICKTNSSNPACEFSNWPEAARPWERVHIDFAGPVFNHMWLVCVDAYSQYPYVTQLKTTTTTDTLMALSAIFAIEGLPETLVSDNGPQLTADLFKQFCAKNGIKHVTSAPFHPASNGLAERFVRTFKTAMVKNLQDGLSIPAALIKYLSTYRSMPNAEGKTPAQLLHGRAVRTLLSQALPITQSTPNNKANAKFKPSQLVYMRNYARGPKWIKGCIDRVLGKMTYIVHSPMGYQKRHQNQLKERNEDRPTAQPFFDATVHKHSSCAVNPAERNITEQSTSLHESPAAEPLRRSERNRNPVDRFMVEDFQK
ncbi:uncharacterized protein K02A2.6-like [Rhagoletis pomonella]|nr:uncharacterized protein K02A2.6-like [Rhagoletis pomonella]